MVDASGAFTMTEGDDITGYNATSSNDNGMPPPRRTPMGMVTIMGVAAGEAPLSQ